MTRLTNVGIVVFSLFPLLACAPKQLPTETAKTEKQEKCRDSADVAENWVNGSDRGCVEKITHDLDKFQEFARGALERAPDKAYQAAIEEKWPLDVRTQKVYAVHGVEKGDFQLAEAYLESSRGLDEVAVAYARVAKVDASKALFERAFVVSFDSKSTAAHGSRKAALQMVSTAKALEPARLKKLCDAFIDHGFSVEGYECVSRAASRDRQTAAGFEQIASKAISSLPSAHLSDVTELEKKGVPIRVGSAHACADKNLNFRLQGNGFKYPSSPSDLDLDILMTLARSAEVVQSEDGLVLSDEGRCYAQVAALECVSLLVREQDCKRVDSLALFAGVLRPEELSTFVDAVFSAKTKARVESNSPLAFALHVTLANVLPEDGSKVKGASFHRNEARAYWKKLHPVTEFVEEDYFHEKR